MLTPLVLLLWNIRGELSVSCDIQINLNNVIFASLGVGHYNPQYNQVTGLTMHFLTFPMVLHIIP